MPRPMPLVEPVTNAVLPCRLIVVSSHNAGGVERADDHKDRQRFDDGDAENIPIRLTMGEAGNRQQGDDGAVVGQGVHAAAGHDATRCSTSMGMLAAWAAAMKLSDIAASAMLIPPDAEPVIPASKVTVTASLTSGSGMVFSALASTRKPGSDAMTAPKPYSEAVFMAASKAPLTALLLPSASLLRIALKPKARTMRMPINSAASTAQMAVSLAISVWTGVAMPGSARVWVLPYH